MKTTLILPVAGKSSRFPGMRPKWLLTMPNGNLMVEEAVKGLELQKYSKIIIICLNEHLKKYCDLEMLRKTFKRNISKKIEFLILKRPTSCQAETVAKAIKKFSLSGAIYIKDCDNYFESEYINSNAISTVNLNEIDLIDAKNKSYVQLGNKGNVENIVEKKVISDDFCCGGYGFKSGIKFLEIYEGLKKKNPEEEIYISHVIYAMLLNGENFTTNRAKNYVDFGTLREYRHYCDKFITVFCDVDGVLLENGSKFQKNGWATKPIKENLSKLIELQKKGLLYLVITTSRPKDQEDFVIKSLSKMGLKVDAYLHSLPHTKRLLINDFSLTNPYPTAMSINLPRNSINLESYLEHLKK